jgi:predicted  nucleic acid-binding Zn-ribbon protein
MCNRCGIKKRGINYQYLKCPKCGKRMIKEETDKKETDKIDIFDAGKSVERGVTEKDVDPKELARGIEIEKEHTNNPKIAKKITLDHLSEIPGKKRKAKKGGYNTRLDKMEKEAEEDGDKI